jgi:3-dehydroquinate synthetase
MTAASAAIIIIKLQIHTTLGEAAAARVVTLIALGGGIIARAI